VLSESRSYKFPPESQRTLCERKGLDYHQRLLVNNCEFRFNAYEDVTTTLREDLRELKEANKRPFPIPLTSVENKLTDLKEYLPKADKRMGLLDVGGTLLKTLFLIATVAELSDIHTTIGDLHRKQDTIVHSLKQKVTYLKQLDGTVRFNREAVTNLSSSLKGIVTKVQGDFQWISSKMLRNSKHIEDSEIIRQLQYALTQVE
jgi:hypothetical protein